MPRHLVPLMVLTAFAAHVRGADTVDDLRLDGLYSWGRDHGKSDTTIQIGSFVATQHDEKTHAPEERFRVGLMWMRSVGELRPGDAGSFLYGIEASYLHSEDSDTNVKFTSDGGVADLHAGWGFALAPQCHVEITALGGVGPVGTKLDSTIPGFTGTSNDDAWLWEYGARAATYITTDTGWQIGLEGRYTNGYTKAAFGLNGAPGNHVAATGHTRMEDVSAGIGLGYRFH